MMEQEDPVSFRIFKHCMAAGCAVNILSQLLVTECLIVLQRLVKFTDIDTHCVKPLRAVEYIAIRRSKVNMIVAVDK